MSRERVKEIIARALADEAFRKALFRDHRATLTGYGLSPVELASFQDLDDQMLLAWATGLGLDVPIAGPLGQAAPPTAGKTVEIHVPEVGAPGETAVVDAGKTIEAQAPSPAQAAPPDLEKTVEVDVLREMRAAAHEGGAAAEAQPVTPPPPPAQVTAAPPSPRVVWEPSPSVVEAPAAPAAGGMLRRGCALAAVAGAVVLVGAISVGGIWYQSSRHGTPSAQVLASPSGTPTFTATAAPTVTPVPATPTATPEPTVTATATPTKAPVYVWRPTATPCQPPKLAFPQGGQEFAISERITFRWTYPSKLAEDMYFDLRLWGPESQGSIAWTKDTNFQKAIAQAGQYRWAVAVVRGTQKPSGERVQLQELCSSALSEVIYVGVRPKR